MLTLAMARQGRTVLAPSPMNPLQRPLTSKVGRAQRRSRVVKPFSPKSAGAPRFFWNFFSLKGSLARARRSAAGSLRTSS